jgi:hypothetical protein
VAGGVSQVERSRRAPPVHGILEPPGVPGTARTLHFLAAQRLQHEDASILTNSVNYRLPGVGTTIAIEHAPHSGSPEEFCECGHPHAQHDAVASRYCAASIAGSLTRRCVCSARSN